ncbi:MAG: squalene--hopene cyclase [Planctomycetota bacterium]|jgi:squalene-hopene/tetraprenyl-beta-curcumene cyclase
MKSRLFLLLVSVAGFVPWGSLSARDNADANQPAAASRPAGSAEERFRRMDKNRDGRVTFDEYKGTRTDPSQIEEARRSFGRMDHNGDLKLTLEEVRQPLRKTPATMPPDDRPAPVKGPLTLQNVASPGPNRPDEPFREKFSLAAAVRLLDASSLTWQRERKCFSCHSNYAYLMARPAVGHDVPAHRQIREAAEHLATHPRDKAYWVTETVMVASVLAQNDAATTGRLHSATRFALDRIWTAQRDDGGFTWLDDNEPPSEIDDHYGATMAAIGVGIAPDNYDQTPEAQKGLDKIREYFRNNPPVNVHHRAMKLLASLHVDDVMTTDQREEVVDDLLALQKPDGGWGLATLGANWKRSDGSPQDYESSDGYGTGFAIYVLRAAGVPADDPRIQKGVAWLKTHQRASGRWFTRSMDKDSRHYITHSGTAYAILALTACGETLPAATDP